MRTPRVRRRLAVVAGALASASLLAACGGASADTNGSGSGDATITLYSGQHPQLTQAVVSAFEKQTGIHVNVRSDDGIVLANQILQEGSHSRADVYLTENSPELMLLTEHHLLAALPTSITSQIPASYDSPTSNWVGISVRVSALAYDPALVSSGQLPASILDLAQPKWKGKVAIAPTDSDFVPLVGAVIATYGQQAALNWLRGTTGTGSRRSWAPGTRTARCTTSLTITSAGSRTSPAPPCSPPRRTRPPPRSSCRSSSPRRRRRSSPRATPTSTRCGRESRPTPRWSRCHRSTRRS